jgi:hypothetical protein
MVDVYILTIIYLFIYFVTCGKGWAFYTREIEKTMIVEYYILVKEKAVPCQRMSLC